MADRWHRLSHRHYPLDDSEWITRYGTPRWALIANAITPELRRAAHWKTVWELILFAEPTVTETEIGKAAQQRWRSAYLQRSKIREGRVA